MNILIVEDQPTDLKLACVVLEADGHHIFDARDATEAFQVIQRERPGFILLDLNLPDMNGLTLARKLKTDPATKHIRVIAVTGYASRFTRQDALDAGCDAYITKPVDTRTLSRIFQEADTRKKRPSKPAASPRKRRGGS